MKRIISPPTESFTPAGKISPPQILHAAAAVTIPAKPAARGAEGGYLYGFLGICFHWVEGGVGRGFAYRGIGSEEMMLVVWV